MMKKDCRHVRKLMAKIVATLFFAELLLILASWVVTAANLEINMRSLLSEEGVRWLFGHFTTNLLTPVLAWLLLLSIAYGALRCSGIFVPLRAIRKISQAPYRQRFALQMVVLEILVVVIVLVLLTLMPHAPLLSVTGNLFPSSFSRSIVPVLAFCMTLFGLTYGAFSGSFTSLKDMFRALYAGVISAAPLFVVYVFAAELYFSILFVFGK